MMKKTEFARSALLAAALATALSGSLAGSAGAADSTAPPKMDMGNTDKGPRTPTVSEEGNQIRASAALKQDVRDGGGTKLATINDLLIDPQSGAVVSAVLSPASGMNFPGGRAIVAWNTLHLEAKPQPRFVTSAPGPSLASGPPAQTTGTPADSLASVKNDLIGKDVLAGDGSKSGHVKDLVTTFGTGAPIALVIDTGGLISVGAKYHAVAWDRAKPAFSKGKGSVRIALSKADVQNAPIMVTKAPEGAPAASGTTTGQVTRSDSTGNQSGTSIAAPATRR